MALVSVWLLRPIIWEPPPRDRKQASKGSALFTIEERRDEAIGTAVHSGFALARPDVSNRFVLSAG